MKKRVMWVILPFLLVPAVIKPDSYSDKTLSLKPVQYRLDLSLDLENKKLTGACQLVITNISAQPTSTVPLVLYRLLKINSIRDGAGQQMPFRQQVGSFEDWETFQANFVEVQLASPLDRGARAELNIDYEGYLFGYAETGMRYVRDTLDKAFSLIRPDCLAYPQIGFPSWKVNRAAGLPGFDYEIKVTVPKPLVVANGGRLVDRAEKDGRVTYVYRNIKPAWRMDIAIAPYQILEDPEKSMRVFSFEADTAGALRIMDAMKKVMALYSSWFGPLQGASGFAIIEIPEGFGSQADVNCILQTQDAFRQADAVYQLYHEIAHLWSVKSLDPFPPRFESEGLAMFLQHYVQERLDGRKNALEDALAKLAKRVRTQFQENRSAAQTPMMDYGKSDLTDLSYSKGMIFFYVLYRLMGESDFLKAVGSFYQEYAVTGATAEQFLNHLRQSTRIPLDKLFKEWIYGTESSQYILEGLALDEIIKKYRPS